MKIEFPESRIQANSEGVRFIALVDGKPLECLVSEIALQDRFGARTVRADDLSRAFISGKAQIYRVAREKIPYCGDRCVLLSSDFGTQGAAEIPDE